MSYLIHDAETTIQQSYKRKANPFDSVNRVVANGYRRPGEDVILDYFDEDDELTMPIEDKDKLLVGFNYKFDMLYHWEHPKLKAFLKRGGKIWDIQYAEYLLEGQTMESQMCSLDQLSAKYGGTLKPDVVKEMWEQGINTPDINKDVLLDYLHGDITNTEIIFLAQIKRARSQGQLNDIMGRMEGVLCTTEMEFNGIYVDMEQAMKDKEMLEQELGVLSEQLNASLPDMPPELVFNFGSNIHKSCLLFGGSVKYKKWTPHMDDTGAQIYSKMDVLVCNDTNGNPIRIDALTAKFGDLTKLPDSIKERLVYYKGGKKKGELKTKKTKVDNTDKPKGSQQDYFFAFDQMTKPDQAWLGALTDGTGGKVYSTNKDVIELLGCSGIPFLQALANREKIAKDLGTYYMIDENGVQKGMLTNVMPDGIIHHRLNHNITVTTRLSSSDPNLQNIPRPDFDKALGRQKSVVKRMFVSRFGSDGVMAEVDYSQLEVIVQGLLSLDPTLVQDIQNKVDFHCKRLSAKLKEDYAHVKGICSDEDHPEFADYKAMRTDVKGFTFQRAYGAGAAGIAASTGMALEEVEALIVAEEALYPGITKFYDEVQSEVEQSRICTDITSELSDKPGVYVQCARGYYKTPTQALFCFQEQGNAAWLRGKTGRDASFYRPHIQNYPIQGVGGQLVQYVLGKLYRYFADNDNFGGEAFLVNTVHDCVWYDFKNKEVADSILPTVIEIMESIPVILKEMFGLDCPVPFSVDAEIGSNMLNLSHYHQGV